MTKQRPPMFIHMLLACYHSPDPAKYLGEKHWHSPSGYKFRQQMLDEDLIDDNNRVRPRGLKMVEMICDTPLPVEHTEWKDPRE